jgi:hypothetical protein|tara:strand:- start:994 stop:1656 length:663 start_codon:yes stop_codon:yes gene_type:complete
MDNGEDFIEISENEDGESDEDVLGSEEAEKIEALLSSITSDESSFSKNILSPVNPPSSAPIHKSSPRALENFIEEEVLNEASFEDNRRDSNVLGETIEPMGETVRGDFYSSPDSEGSDGGDFYSSGSGDTRLYESGNTDITGNTAGGGLYGGRNKIDPNERSWADNTRWSANDNSPTSGFSGEKLIDARNMVEGEVFAERGMKDGYSTMDPSKDYESGGG